MSRLLRILLITIGAIIVIMIAGYFLIKSYLTPKTVRNIAEKVVTEALQYPIEIGQVGLRFGFRVGITIDDVKIPNTKGFSRKPRIEIDRTTLNLKLLPLLRRRIVVSGLDFSGLKVNVEKNKQNKTNFAAVIPKEAQGSSWALSLSSVTISQGDVSYVDAMTKTEIKVKDIEQKIKFKGNTVSASGKSTVYILKNQRLPEMIVKVSNEITYDTLKKDLQIKKLTALYDPIDLSIDGTISKLQKLDINAKLKVDDISKLPSLIPADSRPEKLSGTLIATCLVTGTTKKMVVAGNSVLKNVSYTPKGLNRGFTKIHGTFSFTSKAIKDISLSAMFGNAILELSGIKGTTKKPSYNGDYKINNGFINGIGLAKPISNFIIKGTIANSVARISKCGGNIGHSDFSLTGKITNFEKPIIEINNTSHLIDLDEILPKPEKNKQRQGKAVPVTLRGVTKINTFNGANMVFKNINSSFTYENGIIDLKNCTADAFDGKVQFDLYYNINSPEPYRIRTRMTSISTKKILKRFLNFENLEGKLTGISNFQGRGFSKKDVIANLNASANVKLVKGVFRNFALITKLLAWLGMKDHKVVDFDDLVVNFNIDKGKTKVKDWALSSKVGDFLTNGTIGLNGSVNLNVTATLKKKYSNIVKKYHGEWIFPIDSKGQATIDIRITGKFSDPKFSLDKNKIKQRLKGRLKNEFDKKKKEWESKIKDLLKGK
jgi:uncharacterized protein involved in outer membrane biogenesis